MKKAAIFIAALILFISAGAFAQDLPRIAVYVTGDVPDNEKTALGTRMLASLVNSGRYRGIERSNAFLAEVEKEQVKQRSGAIDDGQISELGRQFGVKFICIASITPVFGEFQVAARIVNVETAEVDFIGESASPLKSMADLVRVSDQVVKNMFGEEAASTAKPKPDPQLPVEHLMLNAWAKQTRPSVDSAAQVEIEQVKPEPFVPEPTPASVASQVAINPAPPEDKPESAPEPQQKNDRASWKSGMSVGGGGFLAGDFGGGIAWGSGEYMAMPYAVSGAYLFFDARYIEVFIGYSIGGGHWESASAPDLPYMHRTHVNGGALVKYAVAAGRVKYYPLLGFDWVASTYGRLAYANGHEYAFDEVNGRPAANALSAFWVRFGGGIDFGLSQSVYLRAEALYGLRTDSEFEINEAASANGSRRVGHGPVLKIGIGIDMD